MPKTKTALAFSEDGLPAHAIAEIEAVKGKDRKQLEQWWMAWAQVGTAKAAFREAVLDLVAAERAFALCRGELARLEQRTLAPRECLCGKHAVAIDEAVARREATRAAVDPAIEAFKES